MKVGIIMEKILSPLEIYDTMIESSIKKANTPFIKSLLLGIMAGIFISLGAIGAMVIWGMDGSAVAKKYLGGAVFPVGIVFVIVAGSQLFTGNALMSVGLLNKKIKLSGLLKNWTAVYLGNFIGSLFMAYLIYKSQLWMSGDGLSSVGEVAFKIAIKKCSLDFSVAFYRGVLCNIIVVLAVWISLATKTMSGKILSLWLPISVFVISGYEHCVANMFFIPVAMFHGADVGMSGLFANLIPVTLGNIVGGSIVVPVMYYIIHSIKEK